MQSAEPLLCKESEVDKPHFSRLGQGPEESLNLVCEFFGFLHRREMAAARHLRPPLDVGEGVLGDRPGRAQDFLRENRMAVRYVDLCPFWNGPGPWSRAK